MYDSSKYSPPTGIELRVELRLQQGSPSLNCICKACDYYVIVPDSKSGVGPCAQVLEV